MFPVVVALLSLGSPELDVEADDEWTLPLIFEARVIGAATATARDPQTALLTKEVQLRGPLAQLFPDRIEIWDFDSYLKPRPANAYPSFAVSLFAEWEAASWFSARTWLDTGELRQGSSLDVPVDGWVSIAGDVGDVFTSGAFVRELALTLGQESWYVEVGRRRTTVGRGLIYDDFGTGGALGLDLGALDAAPIRIEGFGLVVGERFDEIEVGSTLMGLRVGWDISIFESIGVFGAVFEDRGGSLKDVVGSSVAERIILNVDEVNAQLDITELFDVERPTTGRLWYFGVDGNILPGTGLSLRWAAAIQTGGGSVLWETSTANGPETVRLTIDSLGWALQGELHLGWSENWDLGIHAFALSGDKPPKLEDNRGHYGAFIGVAPYWVYTGLFFSGGLSQGMYSGRSTAAGVNGHGVSGGGPSVTLGWDSGSVELRTIVLGAMTPPPAPPLGGTGLFYGLEVDLIASWAFTDYTSVSVELDVLFPGSFFPSQKPAFRAIGLLDAHWGI